MFRNRNQKSLRLFFRYFALYMGVFLFVLCLLITIYRDAFKLARNTMKDSYEVHLERSATSIDHLLYRLQRSAYQLADYPAVVQLSMAQPETIKNSVMQMNNVLSAVRKNHTLLGDEVIATFLLYPKNHYLANNWIVTEDFEKEYGPFFQFDGLSAIDWYRKAISVTGSPVLDRECTLRSFYLLGQQEQILPFTIPLLNSTATHPLCNVIYCLNAEWLNDLVIDEHMESSGIHYSLVDRSGQCLLGTDMPHTNGQGNIVFNNIPYMLLQSRELSLTGVRLNLAIPEALFTQEASSLIRIIELYVIFGLFGAFVLTICYTTYHFRNVHRVLQMEQVIDADENRHTSPYRYIQNIVTSLSQARDELTQQVLLLKNTYASNLFENICIRGLMSQNELATGQALLMEHGTTFCVAVLRGNPENNAAQLLGAERMLLENTPSIILHIRPDRTVFILSMDEKTVEDMIGILTQCIGDLGQVGLSQPVGDAQSLHSGYQEAYHAALLSSAEQPVYCAAKEKPAAAPILNQEQLLNLQNWITSGKTQQVEQFFNNLSGRMDTLIGINQLQFFFVLRQLISRLAYELNILTDDFKHLIAPRTDEAANEGLLRLKECALTIAQANSAQLNNNSNQLIHSIRSIIEAEFSDPMLSADYLAERLHYSSKHIYAVVKESTGKTVGDLIEETRLRFATEMLLHSDKKNEEISLLCGFSTQTTYYRAFKRKFGVSPGEWRKTIEERQMNHSE